MRARREEYVAPRGMEKERVQRRHTSLAMNIVFVARETEAREKIYALSYIYTKNYFILYCFLY